MLTFLFEGQIWQTTSKPVCDCRNDGSTPFEKVMADLKRYPPNANAALIEDIT
jgi:hypothetical protein